MGASLQPGNYCHGSKRRN